MEGDAAKGGLTGIGRASDYFAGCREELAKVSKPTRQETLQTTVGTLVIMLVISIVLALMDVVFGRLMMVFL